MEENKTTTNEVKEEDKNNVEANNKDDKAVQDGKEATEEQAPPTKEMKAVVLTSFGGLKAVKIQNKPEPTPGEGEVLIRVKAWYVFCNRYFIPLQTSTIFSYFFSSGCHSYDYRSI